MISVRHESNVDLPPEAAFRLFTEGMGTWWPSSEGYAYGGARTRSTNIEPWVGGRLYERFHDGDELQIGRVIACDPPNRIVFTWAGPDWLADTEVEVRFLAVADRTRITLEHRGFERLGPKGEEQAKTYSGGWPFVLGRFTARADEPQARADEPQARADEPQGGGV